MLAHQLLSGKKGLIFGAVDASSLAWHVAEQCHAEGARLVLTNTPSAIELGEIKSLADNINAPLIPCDATDITQVSRLLEQTQQLLGGQIDFILHAVGQSLNLRRHRDYDDANYNYMLKTIDISALSLHKLLQEAKKQDAIAEYGSVVALTYIGSQRVVSGYGDMGDAKAMLESIARSFGLIYGEEKHVRINTVSQSPTPTRAAAGCNNIQPFYKYSDQIAPLGNADADSCAALCAMLFSDYSRHITMQTIYNDGGFSSVALSNKFAQYASCIYEEN